MLNSTAPTKTVRQGLPDGLEQGPRTSRATPTDASLHNHHDGDNCETLACHHAPHRRARRPAPDGYPIACCSRPATLPYKPTALRTNPSADSTRAVAGAQLLLRGRELRIYRSQLHDRQIGIRVVNGLLHCSQQGRWLDARAQEQRHAAMLIEIRRTLNGAPRPNR